MGLYVDDLLLFGSQKAVEKTKRQLCTLFTVRDHGPCKHFLGLFVDYRPDGLFWSQKAYTERIISIADMSSAKLEKCPFPLSHPLNEESQAFTENEKTKMDNVPYRELLGMLLYLYTWTRPENSVTVSLLGTFQAINRPEHWRIVK